MSRYAKQIDDIRAGRFTRAKLAIMETNAKRTLTNGDPEAALVLEAIRQAKPRDLYHVFMGFCPNADLSNRVDGKWRQQGICSINLWESAGSERQAADFMSIKKGDLIILKKNQKIGETMRLSGFGRVTGIRSSTDPTAVGNVLIMDWSPQTAEIDVPFMGCTATVNLRDVDKVDKVMPQEFRDRLGEQEGSA
jgi:hypothetical protein